MTVPGTPVHRLRHQAPLLAGLVLVWILLWGTWSWANLLSGLAIALAVTWLLPLPPVEGGGARFHPVALLAFLGSFVVDLARSSAQVSWQAIRPSGLDHGAVISVQLRTDSDLLLTMVVETLCLVPGSLVIDLDRVERTLLVHLLSIRDLAEIEEQRARVLATEERVVRAFGSAAEIAVLTGRSDRPESRPDRRRTS